MVCRIPPLKRLTTLEAQAVPAAAEVGSMPISPNTLSLPDHSCAMLYGAFAESSFVMA